MLKGLWNKENGECSFLLLPDTFHVRILSIFVTVTRVNSDFDLYDG